jgi:hypothetical protein
MPQGLFERSPHTSATNLATRAENTTVPGVRAQVMTYHIHE